VLKAYKYRIYPTSDQKEFLNKTFGCCRFVWNQMLHEKLDAYNKDIKVPQVTPAKYKTEYPFLKEVDSLALANIQLQLEKAFRNHFKNKNYFGVPKPKKKKEKQSYTTNNQHNKIRIDSDKNLIYLPKIRSGIKIELHRQFTGTIKSVTISKNPSNNYYAAVLVETEEVRNNIKEPISQKCGVDLGLSSFAAVTNDFGSYKIDHPHYLKKSEKKLIKLQRQLSKKQKDSKNREKARLRLVKCYQHISDSRNDFLHKLSKAIIDENQVIVVKDLNVKSMIQNRYLAKSISDSGWSTFFRYLDYKAQWYGRELIKVDRFYPSSRICSNCGYVNKKLKISNRNWTCPVCGTKNDKHINASVNLYKVGSERPDVKPVEMGSVDDRKVYALPKKQPIAEAGSQHLNRCGSSLVKLNQN